MSQIAVTRISEGVDRDLRLVELGLSVVLLVAVVEKGEYARAEATAHDPITAEGSDAYRYRVRALRDALVPSAWKIARPQNLELTVSPDDRRAILTRAGDQGVGLRSAHPQPKRILGEASRTAFDLNSNCLLDPNWMNLVNIASAKQGGKGAYETWMLLVTRVGDVVRSELSLPSGVTEDDKVLGWAERIILPELDLGNPSGGWGRGGDDGPAEVDVPLVRKR